MNWLFDQPPNCATMVSTSVVSNGHPILFVSHDEDDHGWQFLDGSNPPSEGIIICLSEAIAIDSSVLQLADLPPGWYAWRDSVDQDWTRELYVEENT